MKKTYDVEQRISRTLFRICVVVTIVAMAMMVTEFFTRGAFPSTRITNLYIGVLLIYSVHKEALRWISQEDMKKRQRRGEYFVYAWIILATLLYVTNFLSRDHFVLDNAGNSLFALTEITITTLEACGVFMLTRLVKIVFKTLRFKKSRAGR